MSNKSTLWLCVALMFIGSALVGQQLVAQTYSLPNDRVIPWKAGSDLWNGGLLPSYTPVTCTGLAGNGTSDDGPAIQACINALRNNQCAVVPAGTKYYVNSTVRLKSNTCLRGAQAEGGPPFLPSPQTGETRLVLGSSGQLTTQNFSSGSGSLYPASPYNTFPATYCRLSGAPQKGDTTVTINSGGSCAVSAGTWIEVYGNDDPSLISVSGEDGHCNWCGNNNGFYVQVQIVRVTALSGPGGVGSVATLNRPLYHTPYTPSVTVSGPDGTGTVTEPAGAKFSIITFPTQKAGFENLRIDGSLHDIGSSQILLLQGCLYCWVKSVETYVTGSHSGSAHVEMDYGYGDEVRDSALHDQRSGASGSGYGVYFQFVNTDAKIENNILWHNRHWIVLQGGGSGDAILYNYADDGYTDDLTYLASGRTSHGAHPYFNLFEGNIASHVAADDFSGTSSHTVFFRNWLWGGESNTIVAGGIGIPSFPPGSGFDAVDLYPGQTYYSFVDNVLGNPSLSAGGGTKALWSSAMVRAFNEYAGPSAPVVYSMGGTLTRGGANVASSNTTSLLQGNYDYKTMGIAYNDGSAASKYQASYYYRLKPVFFGNCPWPAQGSDLNPVSTVSQPAYQRAMGTTCAGAKPPLTHPTGVTENAK
jgi:hypothetical protein